MQTGFPFTRGELLLPQTPPDPVRDLQWQDLTTNRILVVAAAVVFLLYIAEIIRLLPSLVQVASRWRGAVYLEHSVNMARSRNLSAMAMAAPLCLLADRFALYRPDWWIAIPPAWSAPAFIGIWGVFLLVRRGISAIVLPHTLDSDSRGAVKYTLNTFTILAGILMLSTALVMKAFQAPDASVRMVLLVLAGFFWLFSLLRTGQILGAHCGGFTTILYLCALEILPAGLLVLSAVLF